MNITIPNLAIEAARGFKAVIVHQDNNWEPDRAPQMTEVNGEWLLADAEQFVGPDKQFKVAVIGFATQSEAFTSYCNRNDAGLVIGGPPMNHPDNPDLAIKKFFWDDARKIMFLLVPGYWVYMTPGGNWNNQFTALP
ncbi:MAG: hypothetical protein WCV86_02645 [Patescibacteria group bacterium]|jgi:hypothetical protein